MARSCFDIAYAPRPWMVRNGFEEPIGHSCNVLMIEVAAKSQCDIAWNIVDRCRSALLNQGILQWDDHYLPLSKQSGQTSRTDGSIY